MLSIVFFKKKSSFINNLFSDLKSRKKAKIKDVKTLKNSKKFDLTFLDSIKYKSHASITKASYCITTKKLEKFLPKKVERIIVKNVLFELAKVLKKIYPDADIDYPDLSLKSPNKNKFKSVKFGNNVLIGKNVKIGKNTIIGSNSIIEHDVVIGSNCVIASNVCDHPVILNDERGLLFDPRSPKSISKSIEEFNAMPIDRRNTIAKKARKFAEENFSLNHMIESFENLT